MCNQIMPCNVTMHWNLTYDMLKFALEYCKVINVLTADQLNGLWMYELNDVEGIIAQQLCNILAVSHHVTICGLLCHQLITDSEGHDSILLLWYTQPGCL